MEEKRKENLIQVIKFVCFSASAGVIQALSDVLLNEVCTFRIMGLTWLSYLISLALSVIWNFTFNRKFTFKSATNVPIAMLKVALYYLVFTPLSMGWTYLFNNVLFVSSPIAGLLVYVVQVVTMLINMVTEFLYQKFYVFKETAEEKSITE